ncbi:hypothetical protein [Nonomuraea sp. SYSU D8015]|uniref:hypothetical protein n=1 Tax=Nonomuraea sp. SYSU D8015 TaxID=2593644 RepID=UPI001660D13E|nr:hypothetical protein [Nonomuraea sp. SYSU D8015]
MEETPPYQLISILSLIGVVLLGILLIAGIALMAARRREHGRGAVIGILGCVVLLLGALFNVARGFLDGMLADLFDLGVAFTISTVISFGFSLIGTGLLIFAVVARRNPQQPAPPQRPGWQQPQQPPWGQPPFQQQPPGWQGPPQG